MMVLTAAIGIVVGAGVGWLVSKNLSKFTGGVCPILCKPKLSIPYFAFLGLLIALEIMR